MYASLRLECVYKLFGLPYEILIFSTQLNYLFIYSYYYSLMDIYFTFWVIIQCYIIYFVPQIVPALATELPFC
jgi:hypothetical protein